MPGWLSCRVCMVLAGLFIGAGCLWADVPAATSDAASVHTYLLPPSASVPHVSLAMLERDTEVEFSEEPAVDPAHHLVRGLFKTGETPDSWMGYLFDFTTGQLYLDLNRNRNLADDQHEALHFEDAGANGAAKQLKCSIPIPTGCWTNSYQFLSHAYKYDDQFLFIAMVTSGWAGDIALDGKPWRLQICDNLNGVMDAGDKMQLFPLGNKQRALNTQLACASNLHVNGRDYQLSWDFQLGETGVVMAVSIKDVSVPDTIQLAPAGQFISYLRLEGNPNVILNQPVFPVAIPRGRYHQATVFLDAGTNWFFGAQTPVAEMGDSAVWQPQWGGPLQHTATVSRRGPVLEAAYRLQGVGGEEYREISSRSKPRIEIRRQGLLLQAGNFEYG